MYYMIEHLTRGLGTVDVASLLSFPSTTNMTTKTSAAALCYLKVWFKVLLIHSQIHHTVTHCCHSYRQS